MVFFFFLTTNLFNFEFSIFIVHIFYMYYKILKLIYTKFNPTCLFLLYLRVSNIYGNSLYIRKTITNNANQAKHFFANAIKHKPPSLENCIQLQLLLYVSIYPLLIVVNLDKLFLVIVPLNYCYTYNVKLKKKKKILKSVYFYLHYIYDRFHLEYFTLKPTVNPI